MFEIKDKVALITGASGGLGDKIARTLHAQGATLALTDRSAERMEKLKEELGSNVECFVADLGDSEAINQLVKDVEAKFGRIDILVNNAGIAWFGLLTDMTDEDWSSLLQTNLSSVFYCCRAAIPHMVSVKCGRIINISSMWGTAGASCEAAYSATKSGIHGLTKALAKELAPSNIQVNAIACGVIDTEMNARLNEEERAALAEEIPSGRFSSPEEVAELVLLLCSSPSYMTGQIIGMDGGFI